MLTFVSRHGGRYEYSALEADSSVHERLELERKARERAQNACQHYLRSCSRYTLLHHLNDIGEFGHSLTQNLLPTLSTIAILNWPCNEPITKILGTVEDESVNFKPQGLSYSNVNLRSNSLYFAYHISALLNYTSSV